MPWCNASGVQIRYERSGVGPTPLVLLHELGGSLEGWDQVVPLVEREFDIVRYDQRGAGLSEKVRTPFSMADLAADLEAVIAANRLNPPVWVAGVAAGTAVAVAFAAKAHSGAAALVLCAPALSVEPDRRRYLAERSELAAREGMRAVIDATLERSFPEVVIRDRSLYENYRARFLANDPVAYGFANRALAESTVDTLVPMVACPCLLLAGAHDGLRPIAQVRALAARFPHASVEVLDSGHIMNVQAPADLAAQILRFRTAVVANTPGLG